jgi:hypothetical protein
VVVSPRQTWALLLAAALMAWAALWFIEPAAGVTPPCPSRALTGYRCPVCGTWRGLHALAHGDIVTAWGLNPLMLLTLAGVVAVALVPALRRSWQRGGPAWTWGPWVVLAAYGVLRLLVDSGCDVPESLVEFSGAADSR